MRNIYCDGKKLYPSKVVCVGRNYVEHIKELNNEMPQNMVLFNKPNSAINEQFLYIDSTVRFEGELSFLIKNNKIYGIGFGFDLTKVDIQNYLKQKGLPWERSKSFDNSAVFSNFIQFDKDLKDISFELFKNNKLQQFANYDLMIYKPDEILNEILSFSSFEDGDIIMSGTPKGVDTYKIGDIFEVTIYHKDQILLKSKWVIQKSK
jgi:2-keto-4-pentenoate hydratase/2-oxohepta-3-ene-1,7-dioic acid hydratase in catechol pathway